MVHYISTENSVAISICCKQLLSQRYPVNFAGARLGAWKLGEPCNPDLAKLLEFLDEAHFISPVG